MTVRTTTLAFIRNPNAIRRYLERRLRLLAPEAIAIADVRVDPVRTTLQAASWFGRYEVELMTRRGGRRRMVVLGSSDRRGSKVNAYRVMAHLWTHGFNRLPLTLPRPIHYDPPRQLLLYEELPGLPLFDSFSGRRPETAQLIGMVGTWLAKFHSLTPPPNVPKRTLGEDVEKRLLFLQTFRRRLPLRRVEGIDASLRWLLAKRRSFVRATRQTLVHQDVHSRNIIVLASKRSIGFLDFNDTRRYDPALDVGTFLLHLDASLHGFFPYHRIRAMKRRFLDAYLKTRPAARRDVTFAERVNIHQAWMAFQFWEFSLSYFPPSSRDPNVRWVLSRFSKVAEAAARAARSKGAIVL